MGKIWLCGIFYLVGLTAFSQERKRTTFDLDTNYVQSYYDDLIVRVYSANRNNFIHFSDQPKELDLKYQPNDYFDIGVGVNYKWFGLNIGTKVTPLSDDDAIYGKTSSLGLQSYLYARKFTVDIMALKTRGYYLDLDNAGMERKLTGGPYYKRRDLRTKNIGANLNYVLNHRRFSYKAAFKQNELQKRSAGSVIAGGGFYMLTARADSAIVPRGMDQDYFIGWRDLDALKCYGINGNLEYAYSWVPLKNWIGTVAYRLSLGVQHNFWYFDQIKRETQLKMTRGGMFRFSTGHHFPAFYVGFSYVRYHQQNSVMKMNSLKVLNGTNYTEFTISKRFRL